jgi:hypothetical protein
LLSICPHWQDVEISLSNHNIVEYIGQDESKMVLPEEMPVEEISTNLNKVHLWVMLALLNRLTTIDDPKCKNKRNFQDQKRPIQAMPADCKANFPQKE